MTGDAIPVVAGLAVGIGFIVLFILWSNMRSLNANDYLVIGNNNEVVKSFLQIFPDSYSTVEEFQDNATHREWARLYYTTSERRTGDNRYDIPVALYVLMDERGRPILFNIYCSTGDSADGARIWDTSQARRFLDRSEVCQEAMGIKLGSPRL